MNVVQRFHWLKSDFLSVSIKSAGAEITSVTNTAGLEFIWQADKTIWARHAPALFPLVGKLKENTFIYNDHNYQIGQHGFARDLMFELIEGNDSSCVFEIVSNEKTKLNYPFDFRFQIRYELSNNTLHTYYKVINPSDNSIFFSVGAHPGFNCPLLPDEHFEDYFIEFESQEYSFTELNSGLRSSAKHKVRINENKLFLSETLFNNDALVLENNQINAVSLCSKKSEHKITLKCVGWPYFGIWSKKGCQKFVCLEPWYGIADHENTNQNFIEKDGIIYLEAKKEFNCSFSLSFD